LNLLVLGDSISWGQGLKDEHKAWYLIKSWLQQTTGREVREKVEAHSGALIGTPGEPGVDPRSNYLLDGELSRAYPTVNGQLDDAIKAYVDPAQVDLVLVNGCINDLDSRRLLNGANTPDNIRELAQVKCGPPVEALLLRITNAFPAAHVVITGYYAILSEKTANDFFIRSLAKRLYTPEAGAPEMNDKTLRARLIAISREWHQTSDQMLSAAARKVDAQLAAKGSRQRVLFADVAFRPENSFSASQSRLWGFDASVLRKLLVVLTLGKVKLRTNDERRNQRSQLCEDLFKRPADEKPDQKPAREDRLTRCRLAAVGHPNRKGAAMYADAVGKLLKMLMTEAGWLKDSRTLSVPANPQ
jgi:lysophospholipase L1-like esterase